jgi:signal transduction histidine kinase
MVRLTHTGRILALVFVFVAGRSYAQSKTDSLLRVHLSGKADANSYNELVWAYVFNQPDSAIYFGKRGLNWCKRTRQDSLLASIQNRIGVAYDIRSMPDSALFWYDLALKQSRSTKNRTTEGGALNNIGLIYWNLGATEKAIDFYIRSAVIFEEIGNRMGLGNTYNNIALILNEDGQDEKSLRYHRKALRIRKEIGHTYGIAASYSNLAQVFLYQNKPQLDSAEHYLNLSIPLKKQLNDQYGLARSYHSLADVYLNRKDYNAALENFLKTLGIQRAIGNSEGYASTYYNISDVYQQKHDLKMMLTYLDSSEVVAEKNKDKALLWKIYWSKAKTLSKLGRFEAAYPYWVGYQTIKDSLVNAERSANVEELETKYRTAEQEKELSEKKASLAEAKLKVENRTKWIFGLLGGLASFFLLGFALFQLYRRRAQAEKDAAIIAERERGLRGIIEATEEERKRIAKDLHDGIVQNLTALSLRLQKGFSMIKDVTDEQKQRYAESKAMLDDSIAEVRNISHQMMPRALGEMGLIPAIDDMLNRSLGSSDIRFEFEHHKVEGIRFPENLEVSLYRICQELINNIIKHSGAKAVSIQLLKTNTHLVLVVEDNGKGFTFESEESRNGIGLMNITSRAKAMNGEVNYQPSPAQGTVATIRIPLP